MSKMNRRNFLKLSAVTIVGAAVQACATSTPAPAPTATSKPAAPAATNTTAPAAPVATATTKPAAPVATATTKPAAPAATATTAAPAATKPAAAATSYKEAPMLAELVKAGKLPAVADRLPTNPMIPPMVEGVGKYGGTIRRGFKGVSDANGPRKLNNQSMLTFNPKDLSYIPNLNESWEQNANATQFTFKMRKGTKWSDGAALDSDAFKWWYERQLLNKTLTPAIGAPWITTNAGKKTPMTMEFPDKTTVVVKFTDPYPLFPGMMAGLGGTGYSPGHYLKQFHADTAEKAALDEAMKNAKFDTWDKLFADRNNWVMNPDLPQATPWLAKNKMSDEIFIMERNPYFWQVDKEGNQLPYVDRVQHRLHNTQDVFNMWILNGEIDWQGRNTVITDYPILKQNETKGAYKVVDIYNSYYDAICPNQSCKNERIRTFNQNRDVRIALSHAINRKEIADLIYEGLVTIGQWGPVKDSPLYSEKQHNAYVEYDVKKANELLDKTPYNKKDAQGMRLWPNTTEPISFIIESYIAETGSPYADSLEVVVKNFAAVGIKASWKNFERSLSETRLRGNEIDWYFYWAGRGAAPMLEPFTWLGQQLDIPFAAGFGTWRGDPTNPAAVEPPKDHYIRKVWDLWDKIALEPDEKKRVEMFNQIIDVFTTELPFIGTVGWPVQPYIVKNGLKNFRGGYYDDNTLRHEGFLMPWTLYWDEPDKHK